MSQIRRKLSKEEEDAFRDAFRLFDKDGGGTIDPSELKEVLKQLGTEPSDEEVKDILSQVDKDGNGEIDFNEFLELMSMIPADRERELRIAFDTFDKDGNGFIDEHELRAVMSQMGESLSPDQLTAMMKEADSNGDGMISFSEFCNMLSN